MKKSLLVVVMALLLFAQQAYAEKGERYIGLKTGSLDSDITPIGLLYRMSLEDKYDNLWFEAELNHGSEGGMDISMLAGYGVYKHHYDKTVYVKAKAGLVYQRVEFSKTFPIIGKVSYDDTDFGLSFGAGGGFKINEEFTAEVEYTINTTDGSPDYLSVGVNYKF